MGHLSELGPAVLVLLAAQQVDAVPVVTGQVLHVGEGFNALLPGRGCSLIFSSFFPYLYVL